MRDLNFDLKRLQKEHDDGSHGTRTARSYALAQAADTLHELGFKGLRATGLRRKHVVALVREWKRQGRSIGTMKNRTAHIRWWAKRIGRPGVVPANGELGIANREYVTGEDKSAVLDPEKLARVKDPHVAMALRLEAAFGLRREEAIKFTPARDDRGGCIRLKGSTTKGGRPREVPVRNEVQRALLDEARRLVGSGALIPPQTTGNSSRSTRARRGTPGCTACTDFDISTPSRGTRSSPAGRRRRWADRRGECSRGRSGGSTWRRARPSPGNSGMIAAVSSGSTSVTEGMPTGTRRHAPRRRWTASPNR